MSETPPTSNSSVALDAELAQQAFSPTKPSGFESYDGALPGETSIMSVQCMGTPDSPVLVFPCEEDNEPLFTSIYITNYRVILAPIRAGRVIRPIDVPLMMVQSWKPGKISTVGPADREKKVRKSERQVVEYSTIELITKHMWNFKIGFANERQFSTIGKFLDMKPTHLTMLPAFELGKAQLKAWANEAAEEGDSSSTVSAESNDIGWNFYDVDAELARQLSIDPLSPIPGIEETDKCGVGKDLRNWFRTTTLDQNDNQFGISPTYPFKIVVPNAASEKLLKQALECRSRARIPSVSFVNLATGACLARASQPLKKKNCYADGKLLQYLIGTYTPAAAKPRDEDVAGSPARLDRAAMANNNGNSQSPSNMSPTRRAAPGSLPPPSLMDDNKPPPSFAPPSLVESPPSKTPAASPQLENNSITSTSTTTSASPQRSSFVPQRFLNAVDCRPKAAAMGNEAMGGGYESGPYYELCKMKFYSIDNIHGVTASFNKLKALLAAFQGQLPKGEFYSQWHDTLWMVHIQRVLVCSKEIAEMMMRGESAIVHCTDGWDRTSQCCALAMMMQDPYFRTIRGFGVLIEKEWCSMGHKFAERNMHEIRGDTYCQVDTGMTASDVESQQDMKVHKQQPSPIFLQWLDCVYQLIRQFPNQFEFTPLLLQYLCKNVYSCHFGTFLTNTAKERVFEGLKLKTVSIWTQIESLADEERAGTRPLTFVNPGYDAVTATKYIKKELNCGMYPVLPCISSKRLVFWEEHYLQFDSDTWTTELGQQDGPQMVTPLYQPLQEYLDSWKAEAQARRKNDVSHMKDVLGRLMVQARPPPSEGNEKKHRDPNAKYCFNCQTKFGWFTNKDYCDECNVAVCAKCWVESNGRKICKNCLQML